MTIECKRKNTRTLRNVLIQLDKLNIIMYIRGWDKVVKRA